MKYTDRRRRKAELRYIFMPNSWWPAVVLGRNSWYSVVIKRNHEGKCVVRVYP